MSPGLAGNVDQASVQPDDKILVANTFEGRIARLGPCGSVDTGFNPGTGAVHAALAVETQPNGKITVVVESTTFDGVARSGIARISASGRQGR